MKPDTTDKAVPRLWKRLMWFAVIWLASVVLTLVAFVIRAVLKT